MKKLLALLIALALPVSLSACGKQAPAAQNGSTSAASSSDTSGSEAAPEPGEDFVIGFDEDDMPFSYLDENGELVGYSVDVARAACLACGWNLMAEPLNWDERNTVLDEGTVDCIWGHATESEYFGDEEDRMWLVFGALSVDACVTVDSELNTIPELAGKIVEVDPEAAFCLEGETANEWGTLISQTAAMIKIVKDAETAYSDLFSGRCDAAVINVLSDDLVDFDQFSAVADEDGYILKTLYSSDDDETSETLFFRGIGACFPEYNDYFDALNDAMYQLSIDGTLQALMADWEDTEWGSLSDRFLLYDYSEDEDDGSDSDYEFEDEEDYGELTEEELEELFGDMSILELTDEDFEEDTAN